jgi:hypothetical protein
MSISFQGKLELMASAIPALAKPRLGRTVAKKSLYRRLGLAVIILTFFMAAAPRGRAQGDKPQLKRPGDSVPENKPPEPKKAKNVKGPRAVGILQLSSNGKGVLVPVAILVDGKFYDASAYKADPIPMALESGTVYEAEQSGDPAGLFTINGALHSKSAGSVNPWVGSGVYAPEGTDAPKSTRKAEDVPVGLDNSGDEPPRLSRKGAAKVAAAPDAGSGSAAAEKASGTAPAASQTASGSSAAGTPEQDKSKTAEPLGADKAAGQNAKTAPGAQSGGGQPSTSQPTARQSPTAQAGPTRAADAPSSSNPASSSQASSGQASEESYYRPTLRRGKPTTPAPADENETVTKIAGKADSSAAATSASPGPIKMVAAVSDAAGPDPQSYKFFWKTGEEEERRNQMLALAEKEVQAYATALAKNQILAQPTASKAAATGRKGAAKQEHPTFENIQFHAFDVWLTDQPVMILSAEAHLPWAVGAVAAAQPFSVLLVARTDIYGDLRRLYSSVTDKFHLDVTPRLELIDVVDADGDKRGELLFRETSDVGSGFVIYRATADKLWKMFDSLSAE